jgi:glycerophosphoryl diester phosphodiesterase
VEVDISPLADGDFLLFHDGHLESGTTGRGPVVALRTADAKTLRFVQGGKVTDYAPATLTEVLRMLEGHAEPVELQLDLKLHSPLTCQVLGHLADLLMGYQDRVRVSSAGDWAVRSLHGIAPGLRLGFDPMLYLELDVGDGHDRQRPPYRLGAYGYRDDHPLAMVKWGSAYDYLAARAEALWSQVDIVGSIWYIRAELLGSALDDGFNWIQELHRRGAQVCAWTLNPDARSDVALARRLVAHEVDRITTDDAPALAAELSGGVIY